MIGHYRPLVCGIVACVRIGSTKKKAYRAPARASRLLVLVHIYRAVTTSTVYNYEAVFRVGR